MGSCGAATFGAAVFAPARISARRDTVRWRAADPGELQELLLDDDKGFFIVDRFGKLRYALSGSYYSRAWNIPTNETVLTKLQRLA